TDAVRGELEGHRARHRDDAALAGRIVHAAWLAAHRRRGEIDDRSASAACDHGPGRRLSTEARALEVDVQDVVPLALGELEERRSRVDAGVVDEHVEGALDTHGARVASLIRVPV